MNSATTYTAIPPSKKIVDILAAVNTEIASELAKSSQTNNAMAHYYPGHSGEYKYIPLLGPHEDLQSITPITSSHPYSADAKFLEGYEVVNPNEGKL